MWEAETIDTLYYRTWNTIVDVRHLPPYTSIPTLVLVLDSPRNQIQSALSVISIVCCLFGSGRGLG